MSELLGINITVGSNRDQLWPCVGTNSAFLRSPSRTRERLSVNLPGCSEVCPTEIELSDPREIAERAA